MFAARALILGVALVLIGAGAAGAVELAGTAWRPVRVGDITSRPTTPGEATWPQGSLAFLQFKEDGQLVGSSECNELDGYYRVAGSTIDIRARVVTDADCSDQPGVMDREGSCWMPSSTRGHSNVTAML